MFHFEIIDKPAFVVDKKVVADIFTAIEKIVPKSQSGSLNIVFVDENCIKDLNKNYRNIDKTTDVLSFHYYENFTNFEIYDTVGEIILSEEKVISQGKEYQLGAEKECYKLIIHSVLHILGYDHETDEEYGIMLPLEEKIWDEVFLK